MAETRWNLAWTDRPPEEARNLNPAFCAELVARAVGEFHKARQTPLSVAVAFLVLPLNSAQADARCPPGTRECGFCHLGCRERSAARGEFRGAQIDCGL